MNSNSVNTLIGIGTKSNGLKVSKKTQKLLIPVILTVLISTTLKLTNVLAAGDTNYQWNFASSGNYTYSDSTLIEVASNTARLATRNYTNDGSTALLMHFDQSSGTSATDSSSYANTGTITNPTWSTGNLNNSLYFDGSDTYVSVGDSASLSFGQTHSIEAWVKFDNTFAAGTNDTREYIIDKGDYQLFYDNDTGQIVYEISPSTTQTWQQVAGDQVNETWDESGIDSFSAITTLGTDIYVGLGDAAGDAEVWKYSSGTWTRIGGDGIHNSWTVDITEVTSLESDGTYVYAGLGTGAGDGEVWFWDGNNWNRIGGDGVYSGWNGHETVDAIEVFKGTVYAGLGNSNADAEIWEWNGVDQWTQIGGDGTNSSWATVYNTIASMASDANYLYAGLGGDAGEGEVWRWSGSGNWEKIGGDTVNSSWASDIEYVYTLHKNGNMLYAGLGLTTNDAEVWAVDTSTTLSWTKLGGDGTASSWNGDKEVVKSIVTNGTSVYAGLGLGNGDAEVWEYSGGSWNMIGGDGTNSGWDATLTEAERMVVVDGTLYAGITDTDNSAEFWSWNGSTWTRVGGDGTNGSWGIYGLEYVKTMLSYNNKIYAATGGGGAGEATLWQYDGNNWSIVGGSSVNGSWDDKIYERINSMAIQNQKLYLAMGATGNVDTDVWEFNPGTLAWNQVGGDGIGSSWTTGYNEIFSIHSFKGNIYAGLGNGTGDAEVWKWDGSNNWTKVGGDGTASSWNGQDEVRTIYSDNTYLYAGLGNDPGEAEVWRWSGSGNWEMIGGDGINSSWADSTYYFVSDMTQYRGKIYAGISGTTDMAEVWRWNPESTTWTKVGGDSVNSSWGSGYEFVETLVTYNGELYAGLGSGTGDGEVWKYNGTSWTKVGGDSVNNSFDINKEQVYDLTVYGGKLYAGIGNSNGVDAEIWAYGNDSVLRSNATSQNNSWHHIAATYDGSAMKIFIDGSLNSSKSVALFMSDSDIPLYVGVSHGGNNSEGKQGFFGGKLDELRLSNIARSSFTTYPYATTAQTVRPNSAVLTSGIKQYENFNVSETLNGGAITYRLSDDGGSTWKYWNGSSWTTSSSTAQANGYSTINSNIVTFPARSGGVMWQAILSGNGTQRVTLNSVEITATSDTTRPENPSLLTALSEPSGTAITTKQTYSGATPYFSWSGATDTGGSGIWGYYVYFGPDDTAEPTTAGTFQTGTTYTASGLTNGETYYLRIKARDYAQNPALITWAPFEYTYAAELPSPKNVDYISTAGGTFGNIADMNFSWPTTGAAASAPYDGGPDILGWQYAVNNTDNWLGTEYDTDLSINYLPIGYTQPHHLSASRDGSYVVVGDNTIYFRTVDTDGNVSDNAADIISYGGAAPTFTTACNVSTGITVTPSTSVSNSFALSWDPATPDDGQFVTNYYYMINTSPPTTLATISNNTATYISNGTSTSVEARTLPGVVKGTNTVYVVSKDDADNYSGSNCLKGAFTLNSTNPDPPLNLSATDASIKAQSLWRASLAWDVPAYTGTGNLTYKIQISEDGSTWEDVATTTGTAYVDTVDDSVQYYWRVAAYDTSTDSINNPSYANAVTLTPKGTYVDAPGLSSDPEVTNITTKRATISWTTDRTGDTRVQFGKKGSDYFDEEPSKSELTTAHTIELTNLEPGTKYNFVAKWTDEDGNTGTSEEFEFETAPAPVISSVEISSLGINSASIKFTSKDAAKAKIYYGESSTFGGISEISTSSQEATYIVTLNSLLDGTKYFYKINTTDTEGDEYDGTVLEFTTLPRPRINNVRIQQVKGTAQPTVLVSWSTNTQISSILTYYPENSPAESTDVVDVELKEGEHRMIIRGLQPQTRYVLIVSGRDIAGNEASSDPNYITTATDTRPPLVSNLKVEGNSVSSSDGGTQTSQLVVSWDTDEAATTQIEYGEGTGSVYSQKTQEDTNLTYNHLVLISGLTPSKVYHLRAISKDSNGNETKSIDTVTITPKATENALDLVIANLQEAFKFLGAVR